jgi:hypothetical protein
MPADDFHVQANRVWVVFDAQRIVGTDIAYLLLATARACRKRDTQGKQQDTCGKCCSIWDIHMVDG